MDNRTLKGRIKLIQLLPIASCIIITILVAINYYSSYSTTLDDKYLHTSNLVDLQIKNKELETNYKICGRVISHTFKEPHHFIQNSFDNNTFVVIGHDTFHYAQTNNHINAILHASDYAKDVNASLILLRNGWPNEVLTLLFGEGDQRQEWEIHLGLQYGIHIMNKDTFLRMSSHANMIMYNTSSQMYYYHTKQRVVDIVERRNSLLRYLWLNPNQKVCSAVQNLTSNSIPRYSVIHSRWMNNNGCLGRLGSLAARIRNQTGTMSPEDEYQLDRKAPCLLQPAYIEDILNQNNMINEPLFIISDGKNHDIFHELKKHPIMGENVQIVHSDIAWIGGDMMLAILADVFIGTPVSTMSGNIARARVALGFDPSTNYMFPKKKKDGERWEFFCDESCLYDVRILNHYVG